MRKNNPLQLEQKLNSMYDVADVLTSYRYWFTRLLNLTLTMFEWDNIPDNATFTGREIELQLQLTGHALMFLKNGKVYTVESNIYDFDVNYNPTRYVYANPIIGSRDGLIDTEICGLIYNNVIQNRIANIPIDGSLYTFIAHYARQLADISSSINIYAVNSRITDYPVAKNDGMKASLLNFFNQRKMGATEVIYQNDEILDAFASVQKSNRTTPDTLKDIIDAEDRILEKFYRSIGVKFRQQKAAQVNVEEVEADEQLLLIFPDDMLKCRQEGISRINEKLGCDITVRLNPRFDRSNYQKEGDNTWISRPSQV